MVFIFQQPAYNTSIFLTFWKKLVLDVELKTFILKAL